MSVRALAALLTALFAASCAQTQPEPRLMSPADLQSACALNARGEPTSPHFPICIVYIRAFTEGYYIRKAMTDKKAPEICIPKDEDWDDMIPKFNQRLAKSADQKLYRELAAYPGAISSSLIPASTWQALVDIYPCK